jgi:hypothetical protein
MEQKSGRQAPCLCLSSRFPHSLSQLLSQGALRFALPLRFPTWLVPSPLLCFPVLVSSLSFPLQLFLALLSSFTQKLLANPFVQADLLVCLSCQVALTLILTKRSLVQADLKVLIARSNSPAAKLCASVFLAKSCFLRLFKVPSSRAPQVSPQKAARPVCSSFR